MLQLGDPAPAFHGVDQRKQRVSLEELTRDHVVVLYFYPRDFTPICTRQACMFRDAFEELSGRGVAIVGVSVDDSQSHERFGEHHQLPFSLLADPDKTIARSYKVLRVFGGTTKRVTYVIDQNRVIRGAFHHELMAGSHLKDIRRTLERLATPQATAE